MTNAPKSVLPTDFTREVPTKALKWLLHFGLSYTYWKDIIGYSPAEERLYFLLGLPLAVSIGRYVGDDESKPKWFTRGDIHKHGEIVGPELGKSIVLVEDLVSAHKVGQVTTCMPLFGVQAYPVHYHVMLNDKRPIVLWLDDDQKGRSIMHKAVGMQSVLNRPVTALTTGKDPKYFTTEEIKEILL